MIAHPTQIKKNLSKRVWIYETSQENVGKKVFCNRSIIPPEYQTEEFEIDKTQDVIGKITQTYYTDGRYYFWVMLDDLKEEVMYPIHQVREM